MEHAQRAEQTSFSSDLLGCIFLKTCGLGDEGMTDILYIGSASVETPTAVTHLVRLVTFPWLAPPMRRDLNGLTPRWRSFTRLARLSSHNNSPFAHDGISPPQPR